MELRVGTRVEILPTVQPRRRSPDFPGWGAPNYRDFLLDAEPGTRGVITGVHSHGSNPWTRYSVRLADGSCMTDIILNRDFKTV